MLIVSKFCTYAPLGLMPAKYEFLFHREVSFQGKYWLNRDARLFFVTCTLGPN